MQWEKLYFQLRILIGKREEALMSTSAQHDDATPKYKKSDDTYSGSTSSLLRHIPAVLSLHGLVSVVSEIRADVEKHA